MVVIGLDPGTEQSAIAAWDGTAILSYVTLPNTELIDWFGNPEDDNNFELSADANAFMSLCAIKSGRKILAIEKVESFGMAVGVEVFETVFWSGRFAQAFHWEFDRLPRREIKQHLCHSARATDANIRQALIDRFGGQEKAIGKKASPGPLYPLKGHLWAAFAVAITWWDLHADEPNQIRLGVQAEF